ncbi:MAG: hypothetical protein NTV14_04265 [Coprothermobacterota bacterium]|nr:hypothetical protein [Coprothermobacterota bacterium]
MLLSQEDTAQLFRLMWGLQFYINQKRHLFPTVDSCEAYARLGTQQKMIVRDLLWEHPDFIDAYLQANPDKRSDEELTIIGKWKGHVAGKFYIFRYLKDYTIFMNASHVYGVKGLFEPFDVILEGLPLPILVEAVLLPYKGQIIYDGLCKRYEIHFGSGVRKNLTEEYLAAKQNGRIQISLDAGAEFGQSFSQERALAAESGKVVAEIVQSSGRLRGGTAIQSAAFGVLRASAKTVEAAVLHPEDLAEIQQAGRQVSNALKRLGKVLERAEM